MYCLSMTWTSRWMWQTCLIAFSVIVGSRRWPSTPSSNVHWYDHFGTMSVRWLLLSTPNILCPLITHTSVTMWSGVKWFVFLQCYPWQEWWSGWHKWMEYLKINTIFIGNWSDSLGISSRQRSELIESNWFWQISV